MACHVTSRCSRPAAVSSSKARSLAPRPPCTPTQQPLSAQQTPACHRVVSACGNSACRRGVNSTACSAVTPSLASSGTSTSPPRPTEPLITFEEVQEVARLRGLAISVTTLGPFYRIVCRQPPSPPSTSPSEHPAAFNTGTSTTSTPRSTPNPPSAPPTASTSASPASPTQDPKGRIIAITTGFVAPPFKLMHCDTLQVLTRDIKGDEGQRVRGALGLGLLLGGATFSYGLSCGCTKAEILAINDDDYWHERLVRYYSYFGFKPVCKVGGNGLSDLPHMLVWGGEGMRMDADVASMLRKWTPALRRTLKEQGQPQPR